jgi:hypothetical protein
MLVFETQEIPYEASATRRQEGKISGDTVRIADGKPVQDKFS